MGPSKRDNLRMSKCKGRERSNKTSVKSLEIIDLTSTQEHKTKPSFNDRLDDGDSAVRKSESKRASVSEVDTNTSKRKDKSLINKAINLPCTSRELDSKSNDGNKDKDDSVCDEDLLLESQFSSQDNLLLDSSQDGEQCDVRWDYTSPETMKHLKKMRGKYCANDVKRIIANFPDVPIKPIPPSLHQLRYSFPQKRDDALIEKIKVQKAKQKAAKRLQQREKCNSVVEDMILFLQQHQRKQEKAVTNERTFEVSSEKQPVTGETSNKDLQEDDNWSDDDLFQDNSFLIAATQNVEKLLPVVTKASDQQQRNLNLNVSNESSEVIAANSCDMFSSVLLGSLSANSVCSTSVIPSSYAGNLKTKEISSLKTLPHNPKDSNHNFFSKSNKAYCSTNTHMNKPVSNLNSKVVKVNGQINDSNVTVQNNGNQQTAGRSNTNNELHSSQRTVFRRHHTFQAKKSSNKLAVSPSLNSPFRRCLSFDDSKTSHPKTRVSNYHKETTTNHNKRENPSPQNISFDSSLTDDLLLQATEDFDSICDKALSADTLLSPVRPLKQDFNVKKLQQSKPANSPMQSFFKKKFSMENQQAVKHKSQEGPHSTSTPVKVAKTAAVGETDNVSNDKQPATVEPDSFMDDDSFMNDDALFESQILPILELAETQVPANGNKDSSDLLKYGGLPQPSTTFAQTATSPEVIEQSQNISSPRKICSQEEIKRKKQAAQRKLLAKTNSTGSIRTSPRRNNNLEVPNNDNKVAGNELKCSQDKIRMKREEALRKRQLKLKQRPHRMS